MNFFYQQENLDKRIISGRRTCFIASERIIEQRLRRDIKIGGNHFAFMPGQSMIDVTDAVKHLTENTEKTGEKFTWSLLGWKKCDHVPREVMWWFIQEQLIPEADVTLVQDACRGLTI